VRTLRRAMATDEGRGMAQTYLLAGAAMPGSPDALGQAGV
jgi:hypothetical protein